MCVCDRETQTETDRVVRRKVKACQLLYQVFSQIHSDAETDKTSFGDNTFETGESQQSEFRK